jgi:acetolactate synthase small subunit
MKEIKQITIDIAKNENQDLSKLYKEIEELIIKHGVECLSLPKMFETNLDMSYKEYTGKEEEKEEKVFTFNFEHTNDPRKGIPYVAKLYVENNKIERLFFNLEKEYGKKEVTITGTYTAQEGNIIEERHGGSWGNDYRYWYLISENGKKIEVAEISNSKQKSNVKKYLNGKISKEDLLVRE